MSGYGPREINLLSDKTVAEIRVKSENGVIKIYTFTFLKSDHELSSNNNIKKLVLENHELEFSSNTLSYDVTIKEGEKLDFKIELEDPNAKYELINSDFKKGNDVIIKVTAENGDTKEYKFNIKVDLSEETNKETKKVEKKSAFLCSDDSILYYLIVFVVGMIIATLIMSAIYGKKIKKLENSLRAEKEKHYIPASDKTEKLYFDDFDQNNIK